MCGAVLGAEMYSCILDIHIDLHCAQHLYNNMTHTKHYIKTYNIYSVATVYVVHSSIRALGDRCFPKHEATISVTVPK